MPDPAERLQGIIDTYLRGWELGDGALSLTATATDFFYEDPNTGRIDREEFVAFVETFKADAAALLGGELPSPFLEYRDVVVNIGDDDTATVWCWWRARHTVLEGSALIRVALEGVKRERIAYYSRLPEKDIGPCV